MPLKSPSWEPRISVPTLDVLWSRAGHEVVAVYFTPPRLLARHGGDAPRRSIAEPRRWGPSTLTTLKGEAAAEAWRPWRADVGVVVAYGLPLPQAISRRAALRLPQSPRFETAAGIWRRADPAGDDQRLATRRPPSRPDGKASTPARWR